MLLFHKFNAFEKIEHELYVLRLGHKSLCL